MALSFSGPHINALVPLECSRSGSFLLGVCFRQPQKTYPHRMACFKCFKMTHPWVELQHIHISISRFLKAAVPDWRFRKLSYGSKTSSGTRLFRAAESEILNFHILSNKWFCIFLDLIRVASWLQSQERMALPAFQIIVKNGPADPPNPKSDFVLVRVPLG